MRRVILALGMPPAAQRLAGGRLSRPIVRRFVAGERAEDAIAAAREAAAAGAVASLDLLGEGVADSAAADQAAGEYDRLIRSVAAGGLEASVSLKLTQLGLLVDAGACRQRLEHLRSAGDRYGIQLEVDMEQSEIVQATIDTCLASAGDRPLRLAIQAYLHRTPEDVARLHGAVRIRLVKGAYSEPAAVAIQRKPEIDRRYSEMANSLLAQSFVPAFGTHDHVLIRDIQATARSLGVAPGAYEFQMLYGIRRDLQRELAGAGERVRVYIPFGRAWYPYLLRRVAERPANLRFALRSLAGRG